MKVGTTSQLYKALVTTASIEDELVIPETIPTKPKSFFVEITSRLLP